VKRGPTLFNDRIGVRWLKQLEKYINSFIYIYGFEYIMSVV